MCRCRPAVYVVVCLCVFHLKKATNGHTTPGCGGLSGYDFKEPELLLFFINLFQVIHLSVKGKKTKALKRFLLTVFSGL